MSDIAERLQIVRSRIQDASRSSGRAPDAVRLIAVSKFHPPEAIVDAYEAGAHDFGENYPQQLRDKATALVRLQALRWHAIGTLQKNKVPIVAGTADVFHALDNLALAEALSSRRLRDRPEAPLDCFVQLSFGEAQKGGVAERELPPLLAAVRSLEGLRLVGLMGMPPMTDDPEDARPHFAHLRALAEAHGLGRLSMGTTGDYEVAISEGATDVRVGTAIFGSRSPPA